jgi:putative nucleotidyltransferase with HDIG domain
MTDLHRKIFSRLLAAWVAISLAIGGGVALYGFASIDEQLVSIATTESAHLTKASLPLLSRPNADRSGLRDLAANLVRQNFIIVQLYDRDGKMVLEEINPRHADLEKKFDQSARPFSHGASPVYEKLKIDDNVVLRVMVPLKGANNEVAGYFEGAFLFDQETVSRLRRELALTLAVVLGAVLLTTLSLYPVILALNRDVLRFSRDLLKANVELMEVLGGAVAKRDSDTNVHNYRVSIYAVKLAEAVGLDANAIRDLVAGAFLHDIGKIGITDTILLKPSKLTEDEFAIMKTHVGLGLDILRKSEWLTKAKDVVGCHHEKFDGSGYPRGLRGEEIPIIARVFAVVDVFDALTSRRPYKEPIPLAESMDILHRDAGSHFDPSLVAVFEGIITPLFAEISNLTNDAVEEKLRQVIERYFLGGETKLAKGNPAAGG